MYVYASDIADYCGKDNSSINAAGMIRQYDWILILHHLNNSITGELHISFDKET